MKKHRPHSARMLRAGLLAAALTGGALSAHAALLARDYNTDAVVDGYYDTVLDITWWANASAAAASPQDDGFITTDGLLTWDNANTWVSGFSPFGIGGWRLPTIDESCSGYGCSASAGELGYMFHSNLGGSPGSALSATHGPSYPLFGGVLDALYWASNTYADDPAQAGVLDFADGNRNNDFKTDPIGAVWAVADGDVLAVVPEPASALLLVAGLAVMAKRMRRR